MSIHVETIILLIKPKIPIPIADENNYMRWVSFSICYFLGYPIAHPRSANINIIRNTIPIISFIAPSSIAPPVIQIRSPITAITASTPITANIRLPPLIVISSK